MHTRSMVSASNDVPVHVSRSLHSHILSLHYLNTHSFPMFNQTNYV
jgi:hypothetical protein